MRNIYPTAGSCAEAAWNLSKVVNGSHKTYVQQTFRSSLLFVGDALSNLSQQDICWNLRICQDRRSTTNDNMPDRIFFHVESQAPSERF